MKDEERADDRFASHKLSYKVSRDERSFKEGFIEGLQAGREENTKAKDIIKNLIGVLEFVDGEQTRELKAVKEAEQFLKEQL